MNVTLLSNYLTLNIHTGNTLLYYINGNCTEVKSSYLSLIQDGCIFNYCMRFMGKWNGMDILYV